MTARYQIRIKNQKGVPVALLTDESPFLISLYFTHLKNTPGSCRIEVDGSLASLFETDGQIEILRRDVEYGILDWYIEWEGFHVEPVWETLDDGTLRFTSTATEYLDLVRREEMGYSAGSDFTEKVGPGETVIKQWMYENIGPGANNPDRVDLSAMPGLSIQPDQARGGIWTGARAWRPLLQNIQEVASATNLAFNIVGVGPAQFEFRVYNIRQGADRSTQGLDSSTGRNAVGNVPVVFSTSQGNMLKPTVHTNASDVINIVYVLGQGVEDARSVEVRKNPDSIAISPWNRRVVSINANTETDTAGLDSVGDAVLAERKPVAVLTFTPQKTHSTVYGRDYFFGDLVTAIYWGVTYHLEIAEVDITINQDGGEDLRFTFL
jgi:hypothetical protein